MSVSRVVLRIGARWVPAACTAAALAACAHPNPGANAAAEAVQGPQNVPLGTKPGVGQEVAAVAGNKVEVTFREGGTSLTGDADKQLDVAARLFRDVNPTRMFVSGHADNTGDEYNNVVLSAKR
ncbi:MAG: OmpA family protein, partial [Acidisphaera sp.]|nr:OmpA family protein [Acidisphaera sp.]